VCTWNVIARSNISQDPTFFSLHGPLDWAERQVMMCPCIWNDDNQEGQFVSCKCLQLDDAGGWSLDPVNISPGLEWAGIWKNGPNWWSHLACQQFFFSSSIKKDQSHISQPQDPTFLHQPLLLCRKTSYDQCFHVSEMMMNMKANWSSDLVMSGTYCVETEHHIICLQWHAFKKAMFTWCLITSPWAFQCNSTPVVSTSFDPTKARCHGPIASRPGRLLSLSRRNANERFSHQINKLIKSLVTLSFARFRF